jgi:CheY-like chemotaxis protein
MNHETAATPVVLIVDDDAQTRLLVTETLEPEGFAIEEAASGNAGLDAFQRVRPALVLLDVTMPHCRKRGDARGARRAHASGLRLAAGLSFRPTGAAIPGRALGVDR